MRGMKFLIVLLLVSQCRAQKIESLGCFKIEKYGDLVEPRSDGTPVGCIVACHQLYYAYALLRNGCRCGNDVAQGPVDRTLCASSSENGAAAVYLTGFKTAGPPSGLRTSNDTETSVEIRWAEPRARPSLLGYRVTAVVQHSYSTDTQDTLEWSFSNNTFRTTLTDLHPGTEYNVSVRALTENGPGVPESVSVETVIGEPDPEPPMPVIVQRHADNAIVRIPKVYNRNGPVTRYRIVVINEEHQRGFDPLFLKSYEDAVKEDIPYYVAAELDESDVRHEFVVGNRRTYNGFYNAPLPHSKDVRISLGVVSQKRGVTKERYAHSSRVTVFNVQEPTSTLVLILGVSVAVGVALLVIGIGAVLMLRRRVGSERRRRLTQSMALTGPCVEIENTGFVPDEEERVDHYGNLKRQLWNIPRNFLEVDGGSTVGTGSFGRFVRGRVQHRGSLRPCSVQAISDRDLPRADRKSMLAELDLLIKANGHENVVSLVGICELPDLLYVVIEECRRSLKETLLSSRRADSRTGKFCTVDESKIFQIAVDIAKGMVYLSNKKITHKRLACRNILMADGVTPKIAGFGLSHTHPVDARPDYTRWTAQEMFRQNNFIAKCDVWSFGCALWELLSLGGTPYPQVATRDVPSQVMRGARPGQLSYLSDELYQMCLNCWQSDPDERPTFPQILFDLEALTKQSMLGLLSFAHFNGFSYEPHFPESEVIA